MITIDIAVTTIKKHKRQRNGLNKSRPDEMRRKGKECDGVIQLLEEIARLARNEEIGEIKNLIRTKHHHGYK